MSVIVAAGLMGGLAMMLANLTKQQHVSQKKAETGAELTALHHRIVAVLYDGDACLETLGKGGSAHNGRQLTKLLNKGGKTVVEKGVDINRALRVESMTLQGPADPSPIPATGYTKEAKIKITIKKLGVANKELPKIVKAFPLTVEMDPSNKIARCHHTLDTKEHGIHTNICKALGGEMKEVGSPTTECTLTKVYETFCKSLKGVYTEPPAGTAVGECNIADNYVGKEDGCTGTSGGNLNCGGNISAGGTVSAGGVASPSPAPTPTPSPGTPSPSIPSTPSPGTPWNSGLTPCPGHPGHYVIPPGELAERKAKAIEKYNTCQDSTYPYYRWKQIRVGLSLKFKKPCTCLEAIRCNGGRWTQVNTSAGICGRGYSSEQSSGTTPPPGSCAPDVSGRGDTCP